MKFTTITGARILLCALALGFACAWTARPDAAKPIIDNERVTVYDVTWAKGAPSPIQGHQHDYVNIFLAGGSIKTTLPDGSSRVITREKGEAVFVPRSDMHTEEGAAGGSPARSILIDFKDHPVPPLANTSGYPLAFPRPRVKKLLENDRIIVWSYTWLPGEATPMHFHDKDVVAIFLEDCSLQSTTPDGKSVVNENKAGQVKFNLRARVHTELLVKGSGSAILVELK